MHKQTIPTPVERLFHLIREDRADLLTLVGYNIISGVLYLAVPLSAQALINTIAAGVLMQPLVSIVDDGISDLTANQYT